jgi:hypothetical protein
VLERLRRWPPGRWFVTASLLTGAFFLVQQVATDADHYVAFLKAVGAAAGLMVLAGLAQRLWEGDRIEGAQLPGGAGAQFEPVEAAAKTRESVEELNTRLTTQSEQMITMQSQLDRRVSDVEQAVFKEGRDRTEADNG